MQKQSLFFVFEDYAFTTINLLIKKEKVTTYLNFYFYSYNTNYLSLLNGSYDKGH